MPATARISDRSMELIPPHSPWKDHLASTLLSDFLPPDSNPTLLKPFSLWYYVVAALAHPHRMGSRTDFAGMGVIV